MKRLFKIDSIWCGWIDLSICGEELLYEISYLTDVKSSFDNLLNLSIEETKTEIFELESPGDMSITAQRHYDYLYLTIIYLYTEDKPIIYKVNYKEFVLDYINSMKRNKKKYITQFNCDMYNDRQWESDDWSHLKETIKQKD